MVLCAPANPPLPLCGGTTGALAVEALVSQLRTGGLALRQVAQPHPAEDAVSLGVLDLVVLHDLDVVAPRVDAALAWARSPRRPPAELAERPPCHRRRVRSGGRRHGLARAVRSSRGTGHRCR